jgi:hypothetical protein
MKGVYCVDKRGKVDCYYLVGRLAGWQVSRLAGVLHY